MRSAAVVIAGCLLLAGVFALRQYHSFKTDLVATQDLVLGLLYFMEQHQGRFPASEEEFLASPFVDRASDGAIVIRAPQQTRYRRRTHGYPIRDLAPFRVRWGTDLSALRLDPRGVALDPDGKAVELVGWPGSPKSGRVYTRLLMIESQRLRGAAAMSSALASRPSGVP